MIDRIPKIAIVFAAFFSFQAFGYYEGLKNQPEEIDAGLLAMHGVKHMAHFFQPWSDNAWPLTPAVLCALLLYALYLPDLLKEKSWLSRCFNFLFFVLLGWSMCIMIPGLVLGYEEAANKVETNTWTQGAVGNIWYALSYIILIVTTICLIKFTKLSRVEFDRIRARQLNL